jgi:hypothetical protein
MANATAVTKGGALIMGGARRDWRMGGLLKRLAHIRWELGHDFHPGYGIKMEARAGESPGFTPEPFALVSTTCSFASFSAS